MPSTLPSTDDAARIADLEAELSSRSAELASVRAALAASQAELEARVAELKAIFGDLQVDALPTKCSPASRQSAADLSASEGLKEARQTAADLSASEGDPQLELTRRVTWSQPPSGTPPPLPCDSSEIEISTSETSRASEKQQSPTASDGQSPPPQQLPPLPLFPPEPISVFSERISLVRSRPTDAAPTAPEPPPRPSQDAGVPPSPPPRGSLMELLDGDGGGGGSGGDVGGDGGDGGDGGEGGGGDGGGGDGGGGEGGGGEGGGGKAAAAMAAGREEAEREGGTEAVAMVAVAKGVAMGLPSCRNHRRRKGASSYRRPCGVASRQDSSRNHQRLHPMVPTPRSSPSVPSPLALLLHCRAG